MSRDVSRQSDPYLITRGPDLPTEAAPQEEPAASRPVRAPEVRERRLALAAAALAAVWYGCLITLTATSANPVMLNAVQLGMADLVVAGHSDGGGRFSVGRVLKGTFLDNVLEVPNWRPPSAGDWLLPLRRGDFGFEIESAPSRDHPLPVYPATPEVLRQAEALIDALEQPDARRAIERLRRR